MKITFLAAENCLPSGITGLLDMFAIANLWQASLTGNREPVFVTEIVTPEGRPVTSSGCVTLLPQRAAEEAFDSDLVILPPFAPVPDFTTEIDAGILDWITGRHAAGIPIAALCTGTFLLATTGLLNGRRATTNWQFTRRFQRQFPAVLLEVERLLTEDNGLICTGAATACYSLGLMLIHRHGSGELAAACAKAMLVDPNRDSQAPYIVQDQSRQHRDSLILSAQQYMKENLARDLRIDAVAGFVHLSPRHFKRRFRQATGCTPISYLQSVRLGAAKKRLETTLDTVDEITAQIGYGDSSTFRRLFKTQTGLSPREYRARFRQNGPDRK